MRAVSDRKFCQGHVNADLWTSSACNAAVDEPTAQEVIGAKGSAQLLCAGLIFHKVFARHLSKLPI